MKCRMRGWWRSRSSRSLVVLHDGPLLVGCEALLHGVGLGVGAWESGALWVADKDERVDLNVYALALCVWDVGRHCEAGAVRVSVHDKFTGSDALNWCFPRAPLAFAFCVCFVKTFCEDVL